jgi:Xaa-Pro aminopeptidase
MKAAHDSATAQRFTEFMSTGWIDARADVSPSPNIERYLSRCRTVSAAFPGIVLLVAAGELKVRANDEHYRFRCSSNFAYLLGPGEPGALLAMEPRSGGGHDLVLFVPPHNRGTADFFADRFYGELWVGRHRGVDESRVYYGIDDCRPMHEIPAYLSSLQGRMVLDADEEGELARFLSEMRLIKDDLEIAELRTCNAITKRAFDDVIRVLGYAKSEREIEAAFWSRARIEANDVGYLTVAAAGHHASTLHWNRNNGALRKGELLLLDAGVEADSLYTADVTRTLPIGGKFSAEQRTVYELVYAAQQAALAHVQPGNDFLDPNRAAMRVLTQGLIDLGVLHCSLEEALDPQKTYYRRYTLHNVSHMLGLDVHDCARARSENYRYGKLREGMCLTIEPGLYFQPDDATVPESLRGIGVRIEDDVIVTSNGYENLSADFPARPDAVEAWMASQSASEAVK